MKIDLFFSLIILCSCFNFYVTGSKMQAKQNSAILSILIQNANENIKKENLKTTNKIPSTKSELSNLVQKSAKEVGVLPLKNAKPLPPVKQTEVVKKGNLKETVIKANSDSIKKAILL